MHQQDSESSREALLFLAHLYQFLQKETLRIVEILTRF